MGCAESVVVEDRLNAQENKADLKKVASTNFPIVQEDPNHALARTDQQIDRTASKDAAIQPPGLRGKAPEMLSTQGTELKGAGAKSDFAVPATMHNGSAGQAFSHVENDLQRVHARTEPTNSEKLHPGQSEPPAAIATLVEKMNPLHARVAEVEQKVGPFNYEKFQVAEVAGLPTLGPYRYANGATYTGQFKDGVRHGRGRQTWTNGSLYDGFWEHGKFSGKGRVIFNNGNVYTGDFKHGMLEGFGEYAHYDGTTYVGEWKADKQNGKGNEKWSDGSAYQGDYKEDLKDGTGVYVETDGTRYEGKFVKGHFVEGTCTWLDGRKYQGSMVFGKMEGQGKLTWPTGEVYIGTFSEHKFNGDGEMTFKDKTKYKGKWANGKQHGEGIFINEKGVERKGLWKDGNRIEWTDGLDVDQKKKPKN